MNKWSAGSARRQGGNTKLIKLNLIKWSDRGRIKRPPRDGRPSLKIAKQNAFMKVVETILQVWVLDNQVSTTEAKASVWLASCALAINLDGL